MIRKFNFFMAILWLFALTIAEAQVSTSGATTAVKGSPYLDDDYVEGVVYYATKSFSVPLRYNAFQDVMEYQLKGQTLLLDANPDIQKVSFGNSTYVPEKYGKSKPGYFAVLDSGKVMLYSKKKIDFSPAKKGGAMDGSDQPAQYKKVPDTFYYKIGNGPLQEVGSIKSMIATFPDKQEELTRFAKKERISPRKEKEIIQFIQYYNSL